MVGLLPSKSQYRKNISPRVTHLWGWVTSPKQHMVSWRLAWRLWSWLKDSQVATSSCRSSKPSGVHGLGGLLESLEVCRSVGDTSLSSFAFQALIMDKINLDLNMCTLGVYHSTSVSIYVIVVKSPNTILDLFIPNNLFN